MMEIEKPRITCEETDNGCFARFVVEPLDRGFGITLGNCMRRVLLSALPGAAPIGMRINGVQHEFSTIPGVSEDVVDIVLNIKNLAIEFIENFHSIDQKNLLFIGTPGVGKTFLSGCIANEIIKKGYSVLYQTSPLLLDSIFDYKYNQKNSSSKELYDSLFNVDLLIIDDLGTENLSAAKYAELSNIINTRLLNSNIKNIISNNLDLAKLAKNYYFISVNLLEKIFA